MFKIASISEVDSKLLFKLKQYLLGDETGDYFVIDESGMPVGRYIYKESAQSHADNLNDKQSNYSEEEAIIIAKDIVDKCKKMLKKMEAKEI